MLNADELRRALNRAFHLGQTYMQQADSESYAANRRSIETHAKFDALREETVAALGVAPARRFDDDWAPNPNDDHGEDRPNDPEDDLTPGADPTDRAGVFVPHGSNTTQVAPQEPANLSDNASGVALPQKNQP